MSAHNQTKRRSRRIGALTIAAALVLASCAEATGTLDQEVPSVVVTTTIWGDVVGSITGDDATVTVLIPVGVDPHEYSASSSQVASIQQADLVVANGLGLEDRLVDVLAAAHEDGANVLTIADQVDPIPFGDPESQVGADLDPHVWFDPIRVAAAAVLIADSLAAVDPSVDWHARAAAYGAELLRADETIRAELTGVAAGSRKLVTNHDSLGYLASRYGYEVIGTVIPGGATLSSPSSADLADLVSVIEAEDVRAIFGESTEPTLLAETIAGEVGHAVAVVELFTGSLGDDGSGADTLIGLLTTDAQRIAIALS
jgi:zinc/manganese transport system substrate-binding protein